MKSFSWPDQPLAAITWGKEEDRFTEALAAVLHAAGAGPAFLQRVCGIAKEYPDLDLFTQYTVEDGRPDLLFESDDLLVLMEVKLDAALRHDQVEAYKKWLLGRKERSRHFFVLAPRSSRRGIERVLEDCGATAQARLIDWERVSDFLESEVNSSTERGRVYLCDFAEVLRTRLGRVAVALSKKEVDALASSEVRTGLKSSLDLLDLIKGSVEKAGLGSIEYSNASEYRGYTLRAGKPRNWWWFGLWYPAWAATGCGPLVLQLPGFKAKSKIPQGPKGSAPVLYGAERCHVVNLPLTAGEAPEAAAARIAELIRAWMSVPGSGG